MQLTVELTEKDVEAFASYHNRHLPQVVQERRKQRKQRLLFSVINTAVAPIAPAALALMDHHFRSFWISAVSGLICGEIARFRQDKHRYKQYQEQEATRLAQYAKENVGVWQIKIDNSGIVVRRGGNAWRYYRDQIGRVVTIPGYTFVYLTPEWAFTIPHHAVAPVDYKAFMQALADLFNSPLPMPELNFTPLEVEARRTVGVKAK